MTRFWFFFRIFLDVLGILMAIQWLVILSLYFSHSRQREPVESDHTAEITAAAPNASTTLVGLEVGTPQNWLLHGNTAQRCDPQRQEYLLQYRHKTGHAPSPGHPTAWQKLSDNRELLAYLQARMLGGACQALTRKLALHENSSQRWFRLHNAHWQNGHLSEWTLYIYEPERGAVYVWSNELLF